MVKIHNRTRDTIETLAVPCRCFNIGASSGATISVMPLKVVALAGASSPNSLSIMIIPRESSKHYITAQIRYLSKFARESDFLLR